MNLPTLEKADPTDFWQIEAAIVQLHPLRVAKSHIPILAFLARQALERLVLVEPVPIGAIQIFQNLLQGLGVDFTQKTVVAAPFPEFEPEGRFLIPDQWLPIREPVPVHVPNLVPDPAAAPGLADQHPSIVILAYGEYK